MYYEYWRGSAGPACVLLRETGWLQLYTENKTLGGRLKVHGEINDMFKKMFGECRIAGFNYAHAGTAAAFF